MIGNDEFNNIRQELSGHDPLIKRIKLRDIQLDDKSIENGCIHIHGHRVPVSRSFFNRLGQMVNLNVSLMNRMAKHEDKSIQIKLLEAVKAYAESRDGGKDFLLIGDQDQRVITNIVVADRYSRLTNDTLFATAETLLNEVPGLSVESIDNTGNSNMSINLVHAQDAGFERLGPDDVFRFGVSLVNSYNTSRIDDFMYRLACANGMISKTPTGSGPDLGKGGGGAAGSGPNAFRDILNQAHIWARDGFVPVSFKDKLDKAMSTQASLAEMSKIFDLVESQLTEEDPDRKIWLAKAAKAKLFPHLEETERRIIAKGFNPREFSLEQKKFIKTGHTIWDLVNDMTWLGSHKSTFPMTNPKKFKVEGGALFVKSWDLEHAALASL
jgi:hypothetical protein